MQDWLLILILALVVNVIIVLIASPPTVVVDRFIARFQTHPQIGNDSVVSINGSEIEGEDKKRFIDDFNHAIFLYSYDEKIPK